MIVLRLVLWRLYTSDYVVRCTCDCVEIYFWRLCTCDYVVICACDCVEIVSCPKISKIVL